jgi:hypothetical protein
VRTPAEFTAELKRFAPGALVWLKVDLGGAVREVKVKLGEVKGP